MSYDAQLLVNDEELAQVTNHTEGGTVALGGTSDACMSITYNYSTYYYKHLDANEGLRSLNGKIAKVCIDKLEQAVDALGTEQADNYWAATEGNAGHALSVLLDWAKQHPEAVFYVQ